jgi:hypothetical protein
VGLLPLLLLAMAVAHSLTAPLVRALLLLRAAMAEGHVS